MNNGLLKHFKVNVSQTIFLVVVAGILSVAAVTRFYQLGIIPAGLTWDEAAIGYNGYSIVTTRRDEWLVKLPVSFRSFGDYKAPLAIYMNGVFTYLFGLHEWSVRFPFALSGLLCIAAIGFLVSELTVQSEYRRQAVLVAMLLAATSPWHLHFSRIGFEAGIALLFVTAGLAALLCARRQLLHKDLSFSQVKNSYLSSAIGALLLVFSLYTYHSAKIAIPIILIFLAYVFWHVLKKHWLFFVVLLACCGLLLYPLFNDTINGYGGTRANVLIFSQHQGNLEILQTFFVNFSKHFSLDFLLRGIVDSPRHGAGRYGVLSPITFILILIGMLVMVIKRRAVGTPLLFATAFVLVFAGITPAALSAETVPHSNRSLLAFPGFILLAIAGLLQLLEIRSEYKKLLYRLMIGSIVLLECLFFLHFWQYYTTEFPKNSSAAFQTGYIPAMTIAYQYEKGINGKPEVDKILVSSEYGQPYIYALFVKNPSPIAYQGGTLYKYEFTDHISIGDLERNNTLVVATPKSNLPEEQADYVIKGSNGETRFQIFYTGNQ